MVEGKGFDGHPPFSFGGLHLVRLQIVADRSRRCNSCPTSPTTPIGPPRGERLLKEIMPRARRVAILINPDNPSTAPVLKAMESAARSSKVELQKFETRGPSEFESAFSSTAKSRIDAVVVTTDSLLNSNVRAIADLAAEKQLPSAGAKKFAQAGGAIGYGLDFPHMFRRAAYFVDRILKGARPADLPVERPTRFEFVVNLKTAKALGLTIPLSVRQRADEVVE